MTHESEMVSDMIGAIYDTALDRALWPGVLRRSAEFVGGSASTLYSKNAISKIGTEILHWDSRPDSPPIEYFDRYARIDPVTTCQFRFEVGQDYSVADCIPYDQFLETRVYKEWAKPKGWVDHLAVTLDKSTTGFSVFGVFRSVEQGPADDKMRRRMRLIAPHVRRAALIGNVLDLDAGEASAFTGALNGLATAVFFVDEKARISFANASGLDLLDGGRVVCREGSALTTVDSRAGPPLRDAVARSRLGDAAIGARGIAIPLSFPPADIWLAHVLPLTSGARRGAGRDSSASAAVFVHQASLAVTSGIQAIAKLYRLTNAELRVLAAISEVSSVSAAAEVVGISEATVKTHLQHLFAKTGTRRQADLVKLVANSASPLRTES